MPAEERLAVSGSNLVEKVKELDEGLYRSG
jgi:hypothetical protein